MNEIERIIKEYKEVISDPGISDHAKLMAKLHAFDDILEEVEMINKARCANCDLYFMAKTKEEMRKGGAE